MKTRVVEKVNTDGKSFYEVQGLHGRLESGVEVWGYETESTHLNTAKRMADLIQKPKIVYEPGNDSP